MSLPKDSQARPHQHQSEVRCRYCIALQAARSSLLLRGSWVEIFTTIRSMRGKGSVSRHWAGLVYTCDLCRGQQGVAGASRGWLLPAAAASGLATSMHGSDHMDVTFAHSMQILLMWCDCFGGGFWARTAVLCRSKLHELHPG